MKALSKAAGGAKPPFVPSETWLAELQKQMLEPTFFDACWRYAERRGRWLSHVRKVDPDAFAMEIVQDIIDDTLRGQISWDPARVTLRKHVLDAVRSRARHQYRRALRRRHHSLDDGGEAMLDDLAVRDHEDALEKAQRLQAAAEVVATIRKRAAGDVEVLLLLEAFEQGATSRAEVLHEAELTKLQYDAARKRLDRLLETLPHSLITQALRSR